MLIDPGPFDRRNLLYFIAPTVDAFLMHLLLYPFYRKFFNLGRYFFRESLPSSSLCESVRAKPRPKSTVRSEGGGKGHF